MLVRWVLPIVTVLAMLAGSISAFAAAGVVGASECCCPDPHACTCHDHDDDPHPDAELKRCGGESDRVAPALTATTLVTAPACEPARPLARTIEHVLPPLPADRAERPETPPF